MIISALVAQCRREFGDIAKSSEAARAGDGSTTLFALGKYPIVENSYSVYKGTSAQNEVSNFTIDKDNGEISFVNAPGNGINVRATFKHAFFRDQNWVEAINYGIEALNGRGFFRQVVRNTSVMRLSANVRLYSGPSACVDIYELMLFDTATTSGAYTKPNFNWRYEQDANKLIVGANPSQSQPMAVSYLRNMKTYQATSATVDVLDDWLELVKKKAGEYYWRQRAARLASQGAATIDEGHFSFTNARTMANDLATDFENLAVRKKPVRPPKDIKYNLAAGGEA